MNFNTILIALAVLSAVLYVVASIVIMVELRKRNIKINFLLARLLIPKYADQYRKMTLEEKGKIDSVFYLWIVSINLALVLIILIVLV